MRSVWWIWLWVWWCVPALAEVGEIPLKDPHRVVFFALGDQGSGSDHQRRVAAAMERVAAADRGVDFVLLLGDNFYPDGVASVTDPQWSSAFESIYTGKMLDKTPFLAILGNHDGHANPEAQVLYGLQSLGSGRWRMRGRQDVWEFGRGTGNQPLLRLVLLDSLAPVERQAEFARQALSGGGTPVWRLVAAHYPLRSSGRHGSSRALLTALLPVLQAGGVEAYLCGHDHHLEVIRRPGEPLQIISGAGGHVPYSVGERLPGSEFALQGQHGFFRVEVNPTSLLFTAFDDRGERLHQSRIDR
ncbi:MAG: metallophosphoesterase [Magnetococcales bacterium]|nr:metallophosphoesterase [Magnetococcales bacterium]